MNDQNPAPDTAAGQTPGTEPPAPKTSKKKKRRHGRRGALTGGLALILALGAAVAAGGLWYQAYQHRHLFQTDVTGTLAELKQDLGELKDELNGVRNNLNELRESQDSLARALDKLDASLGRDRSRWALAETEQLLIIANHRLQLARDPGSALAALQAADRLLRSLSSPRLLSVRRQIRREMDRLRAREPVDLPGLALRLGTLIEGVPALPVRVDPRKNAPAPAQEPGTPEAGTGEEGAWRRMLQEMWHDLTGLVRLRRDYTPDQALLPPEQVYFLRENLRLALSGARHALLAGDAATYRQSLALARETLGKHFDQQAALVKAALQEIEALGRARIEVELPDISGSLEALRRVMAGQAAP